MTKSPTIGLCMIVRDEARVMERCLASVRDLIDTWTICDTGSTDGTPQLIEELMRDVPGELHHRPWVDFGHNRSELMALAKGTADYLLIVDADCELNWRGPLPELEADSYLLRHEGDLGYWIPHLVRGDRDWYFVGAAHEYLALDGEYSSEQTGALTVVDHADGAGQGRRFERNLVLLEADLERDPENERTVFYLAQTLRDLGRTADAIALFERRIELGGWEEEVFCAALELGRLTARSDPDAAITLLLAAHERLPRRAEALHELAKLCATRGWHESAVVFARRGVEIPEPSDLLFVERDVYEWRLAYQLAMSLHMIGRIAEGRDAWDGLLSRRLPEEVRATALENRRRADALSGIGVDARGLGPPLLEQLVSGAKLAEVKLEVEPAWPQFNPSIAADGDGFRMIVRTTNYELTEGAYHPLDDSDEIKTINYLVALGSDLALESVEPMRERELGLGLEYHPFPVRGWEDLRLFALGEQWFALATARDLDPDGVNKAVLLELDGAEIASARVLRGPDPTRHEKNWMPHVAGDEVLIIYSSSPTVVFGLDPDTGALEERFRHPPVAGAGDLRGGSQAIAVDGGAIACVHEAYDLAGPRMYLHRLLRFDDNWRLVGASPRFSFSGNDVEVCTGMALAGEDIVMSFGVADRAAALAHCPLEGVLSAIGPTQEAFIAR